MARISGVDLPKDKRVEIGLTYIYGIGRKSAKDILEKAGINPDIRVLTIRRPPSVTSLIRTTPSKVIFGVRSL